MSSTCVGVAFVLLAVAGCSGSTSQPVDAVPDRAGAADVGCVDEAGGLRAEAEQWYRGNSQGAVAFNGEPVQRVSGGAEEFFELARSAVADRLDDIPTGVVQEAEAPGAGCITHRWISFDFEDTELEVTVWRLVHAAAPHWVANEAGFRASGESTLVADGESLRVVLVVANDGTTVRVSDYGAGARDLYDGWPTTMVPPPGSAEPGNARVPVDDLAFIGRRVLEAVVQQR